ncbi:MAG: hypothetical protein AB8H86_15310 [Polyangiales bacterium]
MKYFGLLLLALICALPANPAPASACMNEVIRVAVQPRDIRRAERIERLLARGNTRAAYRHARQLVDGLVAAQRGRRRGPRGRALLNPWGSRDSGGRDNSGPSEGYGLIREGDEAELVAIGRRAEMLLAILVVRVDGKIARNGRVVRSVRAEERAAHLEQARATLARLLREEPNDPRLAAYDAEAQATVAGNAPTSLETLRDLGARDLVTDPMTWVALANLESGDAQSRALARCRTTVTRGAARVCRAAA